MSLNIDVHTLESDVSEQPSAGVAASTKRIPPLDYHRTVFRNELLTYGEKYNRKSKTIEAFCTLCISKSAANGRQITGHDSYGFIPLREKLSLR